MNDIERCALMGIIMILTIIWISVVVFVINHDNKVTEMMEQYKKENEMLREENKDMQERINALLNINTETNEINWNEEE